MIVTLKTTSGKLDGAFANGFGMSTDVICSILREYTLAIKPPVRLPVKLTRPVRLNSARHLLLLGKWY